MNPSDVVDIARNTLWVIIKTSAPLLIISLVVGLVVSIFQTITSIQDQTLTFVPKILAVFLGLMLFGSWMLNNMSEFMVSLITNINQYIW